MDTTEVIEILRQIAAPGSGHLFSRRKAAGRAADLLDALSAPAEATLDGAAIQAPYNIGQAKSWCAVHDALTAVMPDWNDGAGTGEEMAVAAIRRLAERAEATQAGTVPDIFALETCMRADVNSIRSHTDVEAARILVSRGWVKLAAAPQAPADDVRAIEQISNENLDSDCVRIVDENFFDLITAPAQAPVADAARGEAVCDCGIQCRDYGRSTCRYHTDDAALKRAMDLLDAKLGDTDPNIEGMTQEEVETTYPVLAAMRILSGLYTAQQPSRASEAGEAVAPIPRVHGVGRMADNPCAVLVMLKAEPSDDALRAIHDRLAAPAQQAVALTDAARDELSNIANAKRFDPERFADDTEFADWAQNRARGRLAAIDAALQSHSHSEGDQRG